MIAHLIVVLWSLGAVHAPNATIDACPWPSASVYCVYTDATEKRVLTTATQSDCPALRFGVLLGTLSDDVLEECR